MSNRALQDSSSMNNNIVEMSKPAANPAISPDVGNTQRESTKRYKTKSKTDFIPIRPDENSEEQNESKKTPAKILETENGAVLSIQER